MTVHTDDPLLNAQADVALPVDAEPTIRVSFDVPASLAVDLKHRTNGKLDIAETCALIVQLYFDAPLEPGVVTLTRRQHGLICEALGSSPQSTDQLVSAIADLAKISFAGVKLTLTAEEIGIVHARNATGLPNKEFAEQILRTMFDAWRNGQIG